MESPLFVSGEVLRTCMSHSLLTDVVVELSQVPEDDREKRHCYTWKMDELITVGAWLLLVIAMVGWVGVVSHGCGWLGGCS